MMEHFFIIFQAAEHPEAGNPVLDEDKGETDDEYVNEEEGYSTEGLVPNPDFLLFNFHEVTKV